MFRELLRKNKQLSQEECIKILTEETRGVLSVLGDDDYPYGMPMNHFYNKEDGKIYFHCGKVGHRLDALKRHEKASFCIWDKGTRDEGEWAWTVKSVIVFGRVRIVEDPAQIVEITTRLSHKFTRDEVYIQNEIRKYAAGTLLLQLTPEQICGKVVQEA